MQDNKEKFQKAQYTYQKRKNSTGKLIFNIRLLPAKGVHGMKTQEICRSHTADQRNHDFVCKEMEFFSKSFPKVFDDFPKGAICILKTKKEKGADHFYLHGVPGWDAPGTEV